jgi:alpha,alpha-trehalose phosphorylase
VTKHPAFRGEPWMLREPELDLEMLAQGESLFALSNGHLGWRGNLDEGEPKGLQGSYLNGFYEEHPLAYAESGYGFPESGETIVNAADGKLIRLLVDDEPFDVRYGTLRKHERTLDFKTGTLHRTVEWVSPAGRAVRVSSRRLVSFTQRAIAAVCYDVEPVDNAASFVIQSELVVATTEEHPAANSDPREASQLSVPLRSLGHMSHGGHAMLLHETMHSRLRVAAGMRHVVSGLDGAHLAAESLANLARVTITASLQPGQKLRLVKLVGYGWSGTRSVEALRDQVDGALTAAVETGFDGLLAEQKKFLADFWARADVVLDGDPEVQQALRFGLFHVLQAGARAETRAIGAKGLTGPGYDGHAFWDTETFVLPLLTATLPKAAADALRWRWSTLPQAIERARQLGLRGASFPWRTISGAECSAYWPAGTAALHVNADIADAVVRYVGATGDTEFESGPGLELLVQTARLWASVGHYSVGGEFRIDGVTGPDEYSAVADNNVFTNLMAQHNLRCAADLADEYPDQATALGVSADERTGWRRAADAMAIPFDEDLGVHQQSEGFTKHQVWDFRGTAEWQYPLLQHFPYFDLYRKQVVKQADLVLAMQLRPQAFTDEQRASNFAYYEQLTVRDSSLSAATQSVVAARTGHLELAHDYLAESALIDLTDYEHNVRDGLHLAALAGAWMAAVYGLSGLHVVDGKLRFAPRLPPAITRLRFTFSIRSQHVRVDITADAANYMLESGRPVTIAHHGEEITLHSGKPVTRALPPPPTVSPVSQPYGRTPARRKVSKSAPPAS